MGQAQSGTTRISQRPSPTNASERNLSGATTAAPYPGATAYQGQRIQIPQVQQFFLEGMRPEMGHVGNLARTIQQPQMQRTFTIRNDVNLKKNSLRLVRDFARPSAHHLEFTFDAAADCSIRVYYAATENAAADGTLTFTPLSRASK